MCDDWNRDSTGQAGYLIDADIWIGGSGTLKLNSEVGVVSCRWHVFLLDILSHHLLLILLRLTFFHVTASPARL